MNLLERLGGRKAVTRGIVETFLRLNAAPRPSWHEEAESLLIAEELRRLGLSPVRDTWHNVRADVPPSPGAERAPLLILQGHMDMVCACAEGFRPLRDIPAARVKDGVLRTDGRSSLGADNNLGNAAVLWLLGCGITHGPLRLLFTVAEEVGLEGARRMSGTWLEDASLLLNTDGFKLGRAIVGSAGGRRETYERHLETIPALDGVPLRLELSGASGGHSGDDIHKGRANALILLGRFLRALRDALPGMGISALAGGQAHNAIPTEAGATVILPPGGEDIFLTLAENVRAEMERSFRITDPHLKLTWAPSEPPEEMWTAECRDGVLALITGLFNGVYAMHPSFPSVVGASANLGRVAQEGGRLQACAFLRCAGEEEERRLSAQHDETARKAGFTLVHCAAYPGWPGRADNPLARLMDRVFFQETGRGLEVSAVHVGLEPSIFCEKRPGLAVVSTGPDILDAHSVEERAPLGRLYQYALLLAGTMEEIASGRLSLPDEEER